MRLNAPTIPVFLFSLILVIAVVATKYFAADVPVIGAFVEGRLFEVLLLAYGILVLGNLLRKF